MLTKLKVLYENKVDYHYYGVLRTLNSNSNEPVHVISNNLTFWQV